MRDTTSISLGSFNRIALGSLVVAALTVLIGLVFKVGGLPLLVVAALAALVGAGASVLAMLAATGRERRLNMAVATVLLLGSLALTGYLAYTMVGSALTGSSFNENR